jgi:hypothetical protein
MIIVNLYHYSEFFVNICDVWMFNLIYKSEIENSNISENDVDDD